jgi:hypothetical protein
LPHFFHPSQPFVSAPHFHSDWSRGHKVALGTQEQASGLPTGLMQVEARMAEWSSTIAPDPSGKELQLGDDRNNWSAASLSLGNKLSTRVQTFQSVHPTTVMRTTASLPIITILCVGAGSPALLFDVTSSAANMMNHFIWRLWLWPNPDY